MTLVLFSLGLAALVAGAWLLVRGATRLAESLRVSPLVIGLTVVAFGTSAPEAAVSVGAVWSGRGDVAIGNVVGSNVFNVLFILGVSALILPLAVQRQVVRQEVPIMIGASLLLPVFALDGRVGRLDALALLALLIAYTVFLVIQGRRARADTAGAEQLPPPSRWDRHPAVQLLLVVCGLGLLVLGADWLVGAAVAFATALGVSDVVIGLTIVAAGTSLPEVAASVMASVRGQRDIAVGNVLGSNTFNILGCLGLSGLVASDGLAVPPSVLAFDVWVMLAAALACFPVFMTGRVIARWEGALFLGFYGAYTAFLVLAATRHAALETFSTAMLSFVLPLTIVTIVVSVIRSNGTPR
jgi:cation:H+ antiporter